MDAKTIVAVVLVAFIIGGFGLLRDVKDQSVREILLKQIRALI